MNVEDRLDKLTIKLERRLESKVGILKDREKRKKERGEGAMFMERLIVIS